MSTCPPNLKFSFLAICEIITFKVEEKVFFGPAQGVQHCFGGQKNYFIEEIWNEPLWNVVPK
jgi:hypothetical protein